MLIFVDFHFILQSNSALSHLHQMSPSSPIFCILNLGGPRLKPLSARRTMLTWFPRQMRNVRSSKFLEFRIVKILSTCRTSPVNSALFDFRKSRGPDPLYDIVKSLLCLHSPYNSLSIFLSKIIILVLPLCVVQAVAT